MSRISLVLSLLTLVSCTNKSSNQFDYHSSQDKTGIMGGTLVQEHEPINKWIVGIYDHKDKSFCTGSLIGNNFVLTAAHCVQTRPSRLKIVFGLELDAIMWTHEPDVFQTYTRSVVGFKVHPQYIPEELEDREMDWGDIAIIKFSGDLPPGYEPVKLLENDSILKRGLEVAVAGYGVSKVDATPVDAKKVRNVEEAIAYGEIICDDDVSLNNCIEVDMSGDGALQKTTAPISSIQETEFRLDESKGHGTCSGDSGGPAYIEKNGEQYLVGITSRGSPLCDDVGVYTNAVYYAEWIKESIKQFQFPR